MKFKRENWLKLGEIYTNMSQSRKKVHYTCINTHQYTLSKKLTQNTPVQLQGLTWTEAKLQEKLYSKLCKVTKNVKTKGGWRTKKWYQTGIEQKTQYLLFAHFRSTKVRKKYIAYIYTYIHTYTNTHIQYIINNYLTIHVLSIFIIIKGSKLCIP